MKPILTLIFSLILLTGCTSTNLNALPVPPLKALVETSSTSTKVIELPSPTETLTPVQLATDIIPTEPAPLVPNFDHIIVIVLENKDYTMVAGSSRMPHLNQLAKENVLLDNFFAVTHPSLPNYIAMISGDTQDITKNCNDCFVDQPNLADFIEKSGRTWKTYQEDMPSECFLGDSKPYYQKHNPFIYFDSIRLDPVRCANSIVPLTQLDQDLSANQLPNYSFIMPNICNSSHDCSRKIADQWVADMVSKIQSSPALGENYLIVITFDEASDDRHESCCGMDTKAGGKIFTIFISPLAKAGFTDDTPYSHYSLLKTILTAWELPELGNTRLPETQVIIAPWN